MNTYKKARKLLKFENIISARKLVNSLANIDGNTLYQKQMLRLNKYKNESDYGRIDESISNGIKKAKILQMFYNSILSLREVIYKELIIRGIEGGSADFISLKIIDGFIKEEIYLFTDVQLGTISISFNYALDSYIFIINDDEYIHKFDSRKI